MSELVVSSEDDNELAKDTISDLMMPKTEGARIEKPRHNQRTHKPADPNCDSCMRGKTRNKRTKKGALKRSPEQFREIITLDHVLMRHG